jgi:FixJ family two-component response regulator
MDLVVEGLMNKQIAFKLGISEITVKLHCGNLMREMEVRSVPELVRLAQQIHGASASGAKPQLALRS